MTHGVPYFVWRDGRPRWAPGPAQREQGWKARDLKDGQGAFLPLSAALDMAESLNAKAGVRSRVASPARRHEELGPSIGGYIYFLWVGDEVKIGFSLNPFTRGKALLTGLAKPVSTLAAVRGTLDDEDFLHRRLHKHRLQGEWFIASREVLWEMIRSIRSRRILRSKKAPED